jgi:hypothetical protein
MQIFSALQVGPAYPLILMTSFASFSGAGSHFEALEMNEEVLGDIIIRKTLSEERQSTRKCEF